MTEREAGFLDLIENSEETVHIAAHRNVGIQGWFAAFLKSTDFVKLDDISKQEALDTFLHLKFISEEAERIAIPRNEFAKNR